MNNLIERFIAAMEKIADALSAPAAPVKPCSCEPKVAPPVVSTIAPAAIVSVSPEHIDVGYQGVTDYEALKNLCAERGIEVPPRTKTTTLIKQLSTWDAVQAAKPAPAMVEAVGVAASPQEIAAVADKEADPFVEEAPAPPAARTFEETLVVLQALMKVRGNAYVSAMIKKHTGFDAYKDVKKLEKPKQDAALTALYNEASQEQN